jgi:hypothetical protein
MWLALLIGFADVAVAPSVSSVWVVSVEVRCSESSLRGPERAQLKIARRGSGYSDGTRAVDARALTELALALTAPPVGALDPAALVPSAEELRRAGERSANAISIAAPKKAALRARLLEALADPARVLAAIQSHYARHWTDDYPSCDVELVEASGKRTAAHSDAQLEYMIPWKVGAASTWSLRIGRALAALLPPAFLQRERLSGARLADELADDLRTELLR